jgi:LysR family transcriptional regulator, hydrogen peroxide-inducible genes activator
MTLTELKYIVGVARERHFGRAAEACFVSQPTLSVAVRKLEDDLGVQIFERSANEVSITPLGRQIIAQAQLVLEQTLAIRETAKQGRDPLAGPLRLGVIYTIGPYLLPMLVRQAITSMPQMPLLLQENYMLKLIELLKQGEIDVAIMALPFPESGLMVQPLYDEQFVVAVPRGHAWCKRCAVAASELKTQTVLLLGSGHCFRDQVLEACPGLMRASQNTAGMQRTFEGSSLETIRCMVASGVGITVLPRIAVTDMEAEEGLLHYLPFEEPVPTRRVALVWRKSFTRIAAIDAIAAAILTRDLPRRIQAQFTHPL